MLIIVIVVGVIVAVVGVVLVNVTILFCQQLVTETKYYRLIKVRSRMLQATLTSGNTDTESNFRTLFNMLYKYRICGQIPVWRRSFFYWGIFRIGNKNWVSFVALHFQSFSP